MTVLNRTNDGLFNVLIVLVRSVVHFGERSRNDLFLACGNEFLAETPNQLAQTLNRWIEFGLFNEDGGKVRISETYRSELGKTADQAEMCLAKIVRKVAMLPANNARFWGNEGAKCADLSRGIAWMLAQDVYTLDSGSDNLAGLESKQLRDSKTQTISQNSRDWPALRDWMTYLGFARDGAQWVVDPTQAIRDILPEIFGQSRELSSPLFVERASAILPVIDGGAYRLQVEEALNEAVWPKLRAGLVSSSLSRALQRLDREADITLINKSDTGGVVTLIGHQSRAWRDVSHIGLKSAGRMR